MSPKRNLQPNMERASLRSTHAMPTFLSAVAKALLRHRDEETGCMPTIYVADDFHRAADALGAAARHVVGSGVAEPCAVPGMLRLCAPLARDGWHMLCQVVEDHLMFGVIASEPACVPGHRSINSWWEFVGQSDGIRVWEPSEGIVAIGSNGINVLPNLHPDSAMSDHSPLDSLLVAATQDLAHGADAARVRLGGLFASVHAGATGTLVAVVPETWMAGSPCEDAIVLREPIDLPRLAANAFVDDAGQSSAVMSPYETLAASMIREDGITVLDTLARLRAYRWFVPFSRGGQPLPGGARERAFRSLSDLVVAGVLCAAFIQSSDGTMGFVSSETTNAVPPNDAGTVTGSVAA